MAARQQENKQAKSSNSKDLVHFPMKNASIKSKLMLCEQARQAKGPPKIFKLQKSSVLDRVQGFLPLMAKAQEKLEQDMATLPAGSLDIENIADDQAHVEMSLAVVEQDSSDEECYSDSVSSLSEDNSDEDIKTEYANGPITEDNIVIKKNTMGKRPVIQILNDGDCTQINNDTDNLTKS